MLTTTSSFSQLPRDWFEQNYIRVKIFFRLVVVCRQQSCKQTFFVSAHFNKANNSSRRCLPLALDDFKTFTFFLTIFKALKRNLIKYYAIVRVFTLNFKQSCCEGRHLYTNGYLTNVVNSKFCEMF